MIDAKTLGGLLSYMHTHAGEIAYRVNHSREHLPEEVAEKVESKIYYSEKDVLKLLKKIGLPEPEWGEVVDIDKFEIE